jgi:hypothetical protein
MSYFRTEKVVSLLPSTLTPNTVYFVRTGGGYRMYVTDTTGSIAYEQNQEPATETQSGSVSMASQEETNEGISSGKAVSPATLQGKVDLEDITKDAFSLNMAAVQIRNQRNFINFVRSSQL